MSLAEKHDAAQPSGLESDPAVALFRASKAWVGIGRGHRVTSIVSSLLATSEGWEGEGCQIQTGKLLDIWEWNLGRIGFSV